MPATTNYSFISTFKKYVNSSVILIFFTVLALVCANLPGIKDWYFSLWQNHVSLSLGNFNFFSHGGHTMTVGQVINDSSYLQKHIDKQIFICYNINVNKGGAFTK